MKNRWAEPKIMVQKFTPNEYVAACGSTVEGNYLLNVMLRVVRFTIILPIVGETRRLIILVAVTIHAVKHMRLQR